MWHLSYATLQLNISKKNYIITCLRMVTSPILQLYLLFISYKVQLSEVYGPSLQLQVWLK